MDFRKVLALRGPNIWANFTVLEAWVDLQELKDSPSDEIPGLNDRLMAWLPTMIEHRCSVGTRGGFFERLRRGTYQAHILEHVTLELQSLAGAEVGYGRARETSEDGVYKVAIRYHDEELGRAALAAARELCLAAVHDRPFDVAAAVGRLRALNERLRPDPTTALIVEAAQARGIPVRRLPVPGLVQLGHGRKLRRFRAGVTDGNSAIAAAVAEDRIGTRALLAEAGIPVPEHELVHDAAAAWNAAEAFGGPVVVGPLNAQGGPSARDLTTREQVVSAFASARGQDRNAAVVVEAQTPGAYYSLFLVRDRLIAALRRDPVPLTAKGCPSCSAASLDAARTALSDADVTRDVHSEIVAVALDAARALGLTIARVDLIAEDHRRPLAEQGGVIDHLSASPQLDELLVSAPAAARAVASAIVETMVPEGQYGRVPIAAVTGVNGKTTTTRLLAHILQRDGLRVGMTCTEGIHVHGRRLESGDCSGPRSAQTILSHPHVDAAVLETARGGILRAGLGFDLCDVAVVTNIGEGDHLGLADIGTLEDLAKVKRVIVDVVAPTGTAVLNAADPLVAGMASKCPGSVLFFALNESEPVLIAHRGQGGRAAFVRDGSMILAEGAVETIVTRVDRVPLTCGGRVGFHIENALAAAAAAWSMGADLTAIRAGLAGFGTAPTDTPGRFNVIEVNGSVIVLDYGHNPSAVAAIIDAVSQFPQTRRTILFSAAGDRRDCDLIRQGELIGDAFDEVVLFEDGCNRGRADGEVVAQLRIGVERGRRVATIRESRGERVTSEQAIRSLTPGQILVIQVDDIEAMLEFVRGIVADLPVVAEEAGPLPAIETLIVNSTSARS